MQHDTPNDRTHRSTLASFDRDERAVSPLLGAILLFALLLALLVLIQVTAVPGWNQQVEYEHNQRVQQDMREFDASVQQAGRLDRAGSAVVENGAEYPTRPFLFNPPDPTGTTETTAAGAVNITNANVTGVDTVWTDGTSNYTTVGFQYVPSYNEYANSPVTRYENGVLYNQYDGTIVPLTEATLVDGREITIVTLDGRVSSTRGGSSTVSVEPLAGEARPVSIQSHNGSGPIVLRFPTTLGAEEWNTLLAEELDPSGTDPDAYITDLQVTTGDPYNTLQLRLEPTANGDLVQYQLRMGKAGLDGSGEREGANYLTRVSAGSLTVDAGATSTLTVEARNRYNNPVRGVKLTFNRTDGNGSFLGSPDDTVAVTTGADGQATARFSALNDTATIEVSGDLDGDGTVQPRERTTFTVVGVQNQGTNPNEEDDSLNPSGVKDVRLDEWIDGKDGGTMVLFNNNPDEDRTIEYVRVNLLATVTGTGGGGGGNQKMGDTVTLEGKTMEVGGDYVDYRGDGLVVPSRDELRLDMEFDGTAQQYIMAVTIVYENERVATYLYTAT